MIFLRISIFSNELNLQKVKEFEKIEIRQKARKDSANDLCNGLIVETVYFSHLHDSRAIVIVCYTQMNLKVGSLARKRRKFLYPERVTIAWGQGTSEDQKFAAKLTPPKTNFWVHLGISSQPFL